MKWIAIFLFCIVSGFAQNQAPSQECCPPPHCACQKREGRCACPANQKETAPLGPSSPSPGKEEQGKSPTEILPSPQPSAPAPISQSQEDNGQYTSQCHCMKKNGTCPCVSKESGQCECVKKTGTCNCP